MSKEGWGLLQEYTFLGVHSQPGLLVSLKDQRQVKEQLVLCFPEYDFIVEVHQAVLAKQPLKYLLHHASACSCGVGQPHWQCHDSPDGRIKAILCLSSGLTSICQ